MERSAHAHRLRPVWCALITVIGLHVMTVRGVTVTGVSPSTGTLAGGTRIRVYGTDFSNDRFVGGNVVYIGPFPCTVINHLTSTTVVTCVTAPVDVSGTYVVTVMVDGGDVATFWGYTYSRSATTTLTAVWPPAVAAGSQVSLYGYPSWQVAQDCSPSNSLDGDLGCVGAVVVGDYVCAVNSTSFTSPTNWPRWNGNWLYRLQCSLPAPLSALPGTPAQDKQPGLGVAGRYNTSISWAGTSQGGKAQPTPSSYSPWLSGSPSQLTIVPVVSSVQPAVGSLAGGTVVTVRGAGFPSSDGSSRGGALVQLLLGGVGCRVLSSNYSTITCMTGASNSSSAPAAVKGWWPGMVGINYDVWYNSSVDMRTIAQVLSNWTVGAAGTNSSASSLLDVWEVPLYSGVSFTTRTRAFFRAPRTGTYSFWLTVDDYAIMTGSWLQDGNLVTRSLLNITSWTGGYDVWAGGRMPQQSAPVNLTAGDTLLLEVAHSQWPGATVLQAGVTVPNDVPGPNSLPEIKRVVVGASKWGAQQVIAFNWPAANTSLLQLTVQVQPAANTTSTPGQCTWIDASTLNCPADGSSTSSSNISSGLPASQLGLRHPLLGLQLSVNGQAAGAPLAVAGLLLENSTTGEAAVWGALSQAVPFSSNGSALQVQRVYADLNQLVVVLSYNQTVVGGEVNVTASLVRLAPPPDSVSNVTCFFSQPFWTMNSTSANDNQTVYVPTYPAVPVPPAPTPPLPALTLEQLQASVSQVSILPEVPSNVTGWMVWSNGNASTVAVLPWNATAAQVQDALRNVTNTTLSATAVRTRRGPVWGNLWRLTYPDSMVDSLPRLSVSPVANITTAAIAGTTAISSSTSSSGVQSVQVLVGVARLPSVPLSGLYSLALGQYCDSVELSITDDSDSLRAKLNALPNVTVTQVSTFYTDGIGFGYDIQFDRSMGDVPLLRLASTSSLVGTYSTISISTLQQGSANIFLGPIPAQLLQQPVTYPDAISLAVNDVLAACTAAAGCRFSYSAAATPSITSVQPSSVDTTSGVAQITVSGSGFSVRAADNTITLGEVPCGSVTVAATSSDNSTATQLVCTVPANVPAGTRQVEVSVAGLGAASGAAAVELRSLAVTGFAWAPPALPAEGTYTVLTVQGSGFDAANCRRNLVQLGTAGLLVVGCSSSNLTVMLPDTLPTGPQALTVKVGGDDTSPAVVATAADLVTVDATDGWELRTLVTPRSMPASGGDVEFTIAGAGFNTSAVANWTAALVPAFEAGRMALCALSSSCAMADAVRSSLAASLPCRNLRAVGDQGLRCTLRVVPPGRYLVALQGPAGAQLLLAPGSGDTPGGSYVVSVSLQVTAVWPSTGSIGGGTLLTVTGEGFDVANPSANVVLIRVPVSTTYLNGMVLCDVVNATAGDGAQTQLTCITRSHRVADASSDDPFAQNIQPEPTQPGDVQVVLCDPGLSDINKFYCWSDPTPRTSCESQDPSSCRFAYSWTVTPQLLTVDPPSGQSGVQLALNGTALDDVVAVWLSGPWGRMRCPLQDASSTFLLCLVPALPVAIYEVLVQTNLGQWGVPSAGAVLFSYVPIIQTVSSSPGSVMGGGLVTLNATSDVFNATSPAVNKVVIAGQRCDVIPGSVASSSLSCTAPPLSGRVLGEYWSLNAYVPDLPPDIARWTNPVATSFNSTVSLNWGIGAPPGLGNVVDLWVGRFTFYLRTPVSGNYTLRLAVDDLAQLWLDEVPVFTGNRGGTAVVPLTAGYHMARLHYLEYWGSAAVTLSWDAGSPGSTLVHVPSGAVSIAPPGVLLPVTATVNGVRAVQGCGSGQAGASPQAALGSPSPPGAYGADFSGGYQRPVVRLGPCQYSYSQANTPVVSSIGPLSVGDVSAGVALTINGTGLGNVNVTQVRVGPATCGNLSFVNDTSLSCILPVLPAGQYDVWLTVDGLGTAEMPGQLSSASIRYGMGLYSLTPSSGSLAGGALVRLTGWGFLPTTAYNSSLAMTATLAGATTGCGATVVNATAGEALVRLNSCTPGTSNRNWALGLSMTNTTSATVVAAPSAVYAATLSATPTVSSVSPSQLAPYTSSTFNISWTLGLGSPSWVVAAVGAASNATVSLLPASNSTVAPIPCSSPTATNSSSTASTSRETLTCTAPDTLPAGRYSLWVCAAPWGCGVSSATVTVPMQLTGVTPAAGSLAGGSTLTITGSGFSGSASDVAVLVGPAPCTVTASTPTAITCVTGALPPNTTTNVVAALTVNPSKAAAAQQFPTITFTYSPSLTPQLSSVTPRRGSTAGGTRLTLTGTFPPAASGVSITIAGLPCINITQTGNTTLACTTSSTNSSNIPKPLGPQLMTVQFDNHGAAQHTPSAVAYEYVDLWSRSTTWGGGPPPLEGDTVMIPANTTVLLDVSPPRLYALVLEGNLVFDDRATQQLHLQASYILVKGGNLSIGTMDTPFPGTAAITLHGPADARELPLYGAKVLAVRDGNVVMHGRAKTPSWTRLAATADVGDTSIVVTGAVNWAPGDVIVIASSSIYAEEVDQSAITAATLGADGNTTLTLASPLLYTHLGVVLTMPGDDRGHRLDMRAEVAVLNRSIIFRGDDSSWDTMFGAQIMVSTPMNRGAALRATLNMFNVEVAAAGQAFRLGRYPIHWHMHGDAAYRSQVIGCSIHDTFQRAVTVHGTHRVILRNNAAYNNMGHAYFFEDGIETGSIWEGNLGMLTRVSNALLNTDTSPATFWVTNPNNTLVGNAAAGSAAYGFWYRFLQNPEGPSTTTSVCPKFTPLGAFQNNVAHSNIFYGLRIFPEYYPKLNPCDSSFNQVPAVFDGLVSYKNGMKCAIATQVGLVQFRNFTVGDCGAGPKQHVINGKENGGALEFAWIVDDRNRLSTPLAYMAGVQNALIISRTQVGRRGTAGAWPSGRPVRGITTHSPPLGEPRHTALLSLINVTMVDWSGGQFFALEACGKCKTFQGGATASTANFKFLSQSSPPAPVALSSWTWGHQGVFLDTDGTLLTPAVLPSGTAVPAGANWSLATPGLTWHSAVENELFDPKDCVYVAGPGAVCRPELVFRRIMVNDHQPPAILYRDLLVTASSTNRTSRVHFTNYNEMGYQFTAATRQDMWLHWDSPVDIPVQQLTMHKIDPLNTTVGWLTTSLKYVQKYDRMLVNNKAVPKPALTSRPTNDSGQPHGTTFYNKNFTPLGWWYGNVTYNVTTASFWLAGDSNGWLTIQPRLCPEEGCNSLGSGPSDFRNGTLLWSDTATWVNRVGGKPQAGQNVTIPEGWDLLLDESPPPLGMLLVGGNLTVSNTSAINLTASHIIVQGSGRLVAGTPGRPHPANFTILLSGLRSMPELAVRNDLVFGAKTLAVYQGGFVSLVGQPVAKRWTRLATTAAGGSSNLVLTDTGLPGWTPGRRVLVTSSTYNPWQYEVATIQTVANNSAGQVVLTLNRALNWTHTGDLVSYSGSPYQLDIRAEVALLDSTINVAPDNSTSADDEKFGPRVLAAGSGVLQMSDVTLSRCGQAGLLRACVQFQGLTGAPGSTFLRNSITTNGYDSALRTTMRSSQGAVVTGNVFVDSYDISTVMVGGSHHVLQGNLGLGTFKDKLGKAPMDLQLPATFEVGATAENVTLTGNVAAGSERLGFFLPGDDCAAGNSSAGWRYANNSAHSSLAGLILAMDGAGTDCTAVVNWTLSMNWDFGVLSMQGISTNVQLRDLVVADNKHVGVLILKRGNMTQPASVSWTGGLLVGRSSPAVCAACTQRSGIGPEGADPGCHPKLSPKSYEQSSPFNASIGLQSSVFAVAFTVGPDKKPWDHTHGYHTVLGSMQVSNVTFADFAGRNACPGTPSTSESGVFAVANHPVAPDAFHPHTFSRINKVRVPDEGVFKLYEPDPDWRNEADCGMATYKRMDGSTLPLNCAGPRHAYFRDTDGSLLGSRGTLLGAYLTPRHPSGVDQGTAVMAGPCTYQPVPGAYLCRPGVMTTDSGWAPSLLPPAGIWGDPQLLVLESRDSDSEDRNFSPVLVSPGGGAQDLVITSMDQGWCFGYTCQKRLSTFWSYVPMGQLVTYNFTGTPPKIIRMWLPYAAPGTEMVVVLNLLSVNNRRFIWTESMRRIEPQAAPPTLGNSSLGHGDYYWDQDTTTLTLKLVGGREPVEIRTEAAIQVSQRLAVDINSFYDIKDRFLSNLAFVLGIPLTRIKVVSITSGSTVVNYLVTADPALSNAPIPETTFTNPNTANTTAAQDANTTTTTNTTTNSSNSTSTDNSTTTSSSSSSTAQSPAALASAELLSVLTAMQTALADGSLVQQTGIPVLGMDVKVMLSAPPATSTSSGSSTSGSSSSSGTSTGSSSSSSSSSALVQEFNLQQMISAGSGEPPAQGAPPSAPAPVISSSNLPAGPSLVVGGKAGSDESSGSSVGLTVGLPVALGVAVLVLGGLAAAVGLSKRNQRVTHHSGAGSVVAHFDDLSGITPAQRGRAFDGVDFEPVAVQEPTISQFVPAEPLRASSMTAAGRALSFSPSDPLASAGVLLGRPGAPAVLLPEAPTAPEDGQGPMHGSGCLPGSIASQPGTPVAASNRAAAAFASATQAQPAAAAQTGGSLPPVRLRSPSPAVGIAALSNFNAVAAMRAVADRPGSPPALGSSGAPGASSPQPGVPRRGTTGEVKAAPRLTKEGGPSWGT